MSDATVFWVVFTTFVVIATAIGLFLFWADEDASDAMHGELDSMSARVVDGLTAHSTDGSSDEKNDQ